MSNTFKEFQKLLNQYHKTMTKKEVQKRVLKYGKPLALSKFSWDEKTNTFSTNENDLVLDFIGINECTFNTWYGCTFITGYNCTFNTWYGCTFKTGSNCTFKTGSNCTFNTGDFCTFNTWSHCTFKTGSNCTFKTGSNCTFNAGNNCTLNVWENCKIIPSENSILILRGLKTTKIIELNNYLDEKDYIQFAINPEEEL